MINTGSAEEAAQSQPSRYGWVIVGAMLFIQTVSSGLGFYNMSVYMTEFARLLDLPLAHLSFAVSLFFIVGGVAGMTVARLLGVVDIRLIMVSGTLLAGAALGTVHFADSLWQIYVLFTLFGIGNTGVSLVVATTMVTQWFPGANRSIALSIASTGLSLGGVIITPLTAYLFHTHGVLPTMPWLGLAFIVLILPVALWVVKPAPLPMPGAVHHTNGGWRYEDAVRTRFFVLLALGYVFCQGAQVGGIAHLYHRVEALGGYAAAATAVQILTLCSISFRFIGGWLVTRVSIRTFTLLNVVVQVSGLCLISAATDTTTALLGAAVMGASIGNLLMLQPLWLAEAFPGPVYPRVFALANAAAVLGVAGGPYLLGLIYDADGYGSAYIAAAATSLLAGVCIMSAGHGPGTPKGDILSDIPINQHS